MYFENRHGALASLFLICPGLGRLALAFSQEHKRGLLLLNQAGIVFAWLQVNTGAMLLKIKLMLAYHPRTQQSLFLYRKDISDRGKCVEVNATLLSVYTPTE